MRTTESVPARKGAELTKWLRSQHIALWTWIAQLPSAKFARLISTNRNVQPDQAVKSAWSGWTDTWTHELASFACLSVEDERNKCIKCPLGYDFCHADGSPYRAFKQSLLSKDYAAARNHAAAIRDAWRVPDDDAVEQMSKRVLF